MRVSASVQTEPVTLYSEIFAAGADGIFWASGICKLKKTL